MEFSMHEPRQAPLDHSGHEAAAHDYNGGMPFECGPPDPTELTASSESALDARPEKIKLEPLEVEHEQAVGTWQVYDQSSDPTAVYDALLDFNMDWYKHLDDFHIYSRPKDDTGTLAAGLALRVSDGYLLEVCGPNGQHDVSALVRPEVIEHLGQLSGGEKYVHAAEDMKMRLNIDQKMYKDGLPDIDAVLTDEEVKFLYEVDQNIDGFMQGWHWGQVRRSERGERDLPALARLIEEQVDEQFATVYRAYERIVAVQARMPGKEADAERAFSEQEIHELLEQKQQQWLANGVYERIATQHIEYGGVHHDLVMTPGALATCDGIIKLAQQFGRQTGTDLVIDESFENATYADAQLAGGSGPVAFSLIPRRLNNMRSYTRTDTQREALDGLQQRYPEFNYHVPSVLEAVCRWYVLDEQGLLSDNRKSELFAVNHFDQPAVTQKDGWDHWPYTGLYYTQPIIGMMPDHSSYPPRMAIG